MTAPRGEWWIDPAWTTCLDGGRLILSGGADAHLLVDEVDAQGAERVHRAWHAGTLHELDEDPALRAVLEAFSRLGAIARARRPTGALRAGLVFAGDVDTPLAELLRTFAGRHGLRLEAGGDGAELVILCRTNADLLTAAKAAPAEVPHLFVDLAFQHTLSLGPLVWPGETACIGCLAGRIAAVWGDPPPPPAPAAGTARELVAALVLERLRQFASVGTCPSLVERAVAIDLTTLETRSDRVHRLPWCPDCFPATPAAGGGRLPLPWSRR
jgi:bacteriocin biosynthesis cyclodehydratase domain-containing protein